METRNFYSNQEGGGTAFSILQPLMEHELADIPPERTLEIMMLIRDLTLSITSCLLVSLSNSAVLMYWMHSTMASKKLKPRSAVAFESTDAMFFLFFRFVISPETTAAYCNTPEQSVTYSPLAELLQSVSTLRFHCP